MIACKNCQSDCSENAQLCWKCGEKLERFCPSDAAACSGTEADVCADIAARQRVGIAKYRMTVAKNPLSLRQWLQHAYEECLDQAVYLKRAMAEMDRQNDLAEARRNDAPPSEKP